MDLWLIVPLPLPRCISFHICLFSRGADGAELDVAEPDRGVWLLSLHIGGNTGSDWAGSSGYSGLAWIRLWRIVGVKPQLEAKNECIGKASNHSTTNSTVFSLF